MLLAVDAGNSRVKWALRHDDTWQRHGNCPLNDNYNELANCVADADICAFSCVTSQEHCIKIMQILSSVTTTLVHACATGYGIQNKYRPPETLGADRWCALVAIRALCEYGVIVQCGTAVTIDYLDKNGMFHGGLILPGRHLMHEALKKATLLQSPVPNKSLPKPNNTAGAIAAGSLYAIAGAVNKYRQLVNAQNAPLLLAGGDAVALAPLLPDVQMTPHIVLDGLRVILAKDT